MLSINDFNHLKLLYEQFHKMNLHIKSLILANDWESVNFAIQDKEKLQRKILSFEKPHVEEIKKCPELLNFRKKLIQLEKDNIELVKSLRQNILKEISNVKLARKILNTYEPSTNKIVSTFEVKDE